MSPEVTISRRSMRIQVALVALVALVLGGVGVWSISIVLRPAKVPLDETTFTYVTVEPGEVGSSISLNTVAAWSPEQAGTNQAAGVVTDVAISAGDDVTQGAVLYSVNLRPVVVAQGLVPAFRSITQNTRGADVAQLQKMLAETGFYTGSADGEIGAKTISAIQAWQESLGTLPTGVVELGDIMFVPSLPARVTLDKIGRASCRERVF